ncbi:MAG: MaoC family dehydratase N-terminal domain-containing protein [Saccharopolyspora sp.]|uniref:MaoC/PaaZ C-terminal domain-containing protein n=1 Tax=Saccharopolyspora TaxID=1835 RepID=UPI00190CC235|nr:MULTISPECIES: MaoC/PaaZ C-terminal domain-containing protein [unclassified Saccharopolyspora]MBK0867867.1 MaoC family dehydratase N-terminal domain-containing protein [Saccharopolyspora sp. HNM0986]MBQ6643928.1 MaoC family dehydratase N-terminal domain-containing protein [Saccharopolyspora sp.]
MTSEPVRTAASSGADRSHGSVGAYEDFTVGRRFEAGPREVTEHDLTAFAAISGDQHPLHHDAEFAARTRFGKPVLHGPFGIAVFFGMFHDLGLVPDSEVALLDTNWRYLRPIFPGDALRMTMTIIRCHRTGDGSRGVVDRHVRLLNQDDETVQEGTTAFLVPARGTGPDPAGRRFGTVAWAEALTERLDERFASAVATWDGAIGLRSGDDEVQLRIYRGRVLEAATRTPHGPAFTLAASPLVWTELVTAQRNDFMQRAMNGDFQVSGNAYEYLRLTKALQLIAEAARGAGQEQR